MKRTNKTQNSSQETKTETMPFSETYAGNNTLDAYSGVMNFDNESYSKTRIQKSLTYVVDRRK